MRWEEVAHSPETDLESPPPETYGFLILWPLYGTRDAPLRWPTKLPDALIRMGLRQMNSKLDSPRKICGFVIVHVGDLLYTGPLDFRH